jgi:hypothetical protein
VEWLRVIASDGDMPHLIISGMLRSTIDAADTRHLRSMLIDVWDLRLRLRLSMSCFSRDITDSA